MGRRSLPSLRLWLQSTTVLAVLAGYALLMLVAGFEMAAAAKLLGVSTSQLIRLFRQVPAAWVAINRLRAATGLPRLK